jgi:tRNA-dihydrouridine synthase B
MIGRGSYGRPWWPGVIANALDSNSGRTPPSLLEEIDIVNGHLELIWSHYGKAHGNRIARKHLGWIVGRKVEAGVISASEGKIWRDRLMTLADNAVVRTTILDFYSQLSSPSVIAA